MTPCGTVGYTAPEIVKDERYSKSVDMWALGCVLYTLLCGFPPFYDESIQVLTEKVARGQYTFLSPWWDDISQSAQNLVSHLLTVDPDKRFTIKEFLAHPWICQTDEETQAAADAPPLATPLAVRQQEQKLDATAAGQAPHPPTSTRSDQGPVLVERPLDFRSPGTINLREVFDVGYAVRRQEEEGKRRKNFRQGYRGTNPSTAFQTALNPLNEDSDDEAPDAAHIEANYPPQKIAKSSQQATADVADMEAKLRSTNLNAQSRQQGYGQHSAAVTASARKNAAQQAKHPFELSLDHATLLEKRSRRQQGQVA